MLGALIRMCDLSWDNVGQITDGSLDYWYYTGDDEYVNLTTQGLLFQVGSNDDYMPINQTRTEGNDDQGFWGLAVMSAAEYNFPNPPSDKPQWLALAQAVYNTQASRWDTENCGGGLRWQIFEWNKGFDYKNSISQACFFALGARLALYTGNNTYSDWAERTWDWMLDLEFINQKNWYVYDGAHIPSNCTEIVPYQFSYNAGGFILGAAAMYNHTEDPKWKERLDNLLEGAKVFFTGDNKDIMTEVACEPVNLCNIDQQSFKAYLSRWLAAATQWAPYTYDTIRPLLKASAIAAAKQCVGGSNGQMCGLVWNEDKYDGTTGVGQQMAAMEVTLSCMIKERAPPLKSDTGGTSQGDPGAGGDDIGRKSPPPPWGPIGAGDTAGAAILTVTVLAVFVAGVIWMFVDETSEKSAMAQFKDFSSETRGVISAVAAGGGLAAVLHRPQKDEVFRNEKSAAAFTEDSSRSSSSNQVPPFPPAVIARDRSSSDMQQRRVSSMPIGWPHNRAVRSSVSFDPDGIYPVPGHHTRTDSKNRVIYDDIEEVATPQPTPLEDMTNSQKHHPPAHIGTAV